MKKKKLYKTTISQATIVKTYELSRETAKAYYAGTYAPTVIAWSVMAAIGIGLCFASLPAGLLITGVSAVFVLYNGTNWAKFRKRALQKEDAFGEFTVDLTEYGMIFTRGGESTKRIPWLAIPKFAITRRAYALLMAKNTPLILPKAAFTSEERDWLEREVAKTIKNKKKILAQNAKKR